MKTNDNLKEKLKKDVIYYSIEVHARIKSILIHMNTYTHVYTVYRLYSLLHSFVGKRLIGMNRVRNESTLRVEVKCEHHPVHFLQIRNQVDFLLKQNTNRNATSS